MSLTERASHLRIRGGRSPQSLIEPSLVARRVDAARCTFEATVDYRPSTFQHLAGVTAYYNTRNWHFLYLTADETAAMALHVATSDRGVLTVYDTPPIELAAAGPVRLGIAFDGPELRFRYDTGGGWHAFGPTVDATILSDEHAIEFDHDRIRALGFTGAVTGMWVWDLTGHRHHADFDDATYTRRPGG
jgi:xylan 1,4-beta-xylosidase